MTPLPHERPTAMELASGGEAPKQIAGKPADVCPYCGCALFVDATSRGQKDIFRYVSCRNSSCKRRFYSRQPPPQPPTIVREISRDSPSAGENALSVYREVG